MQNIIQEAELFGFSRFDALVELEALTDNAAPRCAYVEDKWQAICLINIVMGRSIEY
jgi:hypothetical protein